MHLRSWLCASAMNAKLAEKAVECGADLVHWDLEDSVPPRDKATAREKLRHSLSRAAGKPTAVRINSVGSLDGMRDLVGILERGLMPDVIILPKAVLPSDVDVVARLLAECDTAARVQIFFVVETCGGLCSLRELRSVPRAVGGVIFGSADFATDMGVSLSRANLGPMRAELALNARRLGIAAIDSPCFHFRSAEKLESELDEATSLGFVGKIAIHPSQVAAINRAFVPGEAAIAEAQRILEEQSRMPDAAIVAVAGEMKGPPFIRHAHHVMERAEPFASGR